MNPDPIFHLTAHRNQLRILHSALFVACQEMAKLARLREDNEDCLTGIRAIHGAARGQRVADEFGSDAALARDLFEPLSGTSLGVLLLHHASQSISLYPVERTNPPPKAA